MAPSHNVVNQVNQIHNQSDNYSDYLFLIQTVQSSAFKTLIESLKEILTDVNIEIDQTGMKIIAMDTNHIALIHMKLINENFEKFYCQKPVTCGISMLRLFKLLRTMSPNDTLTLYIENDDPSTFKILIETADKNLKHTFNMKLMDLPLDKVDVPPAEFGSVIRLPSSDFQKLCRDMHTLDEEIEIKSAGKQLIFSIKNEWVSQETVVSESPSGNGLSYIQNLAPDEVIEGLFSLKYLSLFCKCTNLCPNIEIYLKNDYPIIIKYSVANLGEVKFCLAPKNRQDD